MTAAIRYCFIYLCLVALTTASSAYAQTTEWKSIRQGNKCFSRGEYANAETFYRQAIKENPRSGRAFFNLGDTYLAQNNFKDAMDMYQNAARSESNKIIKSMAYHNMGYIYHKNQQYKEAIDFYKEALRNNPKDDDTRYNLALCQKQLKDSESNKDKQQQDQQQQQQKQEEQKQSPQQDKQQPQSPQNEMSKENADQLLDLARRSEQQTREKLNKQEAQPRQKTLNKNW